MYKGIIFDFNGTLFWDSEKHLEAWREFSKRLREQPFTDDEMREYMFGRTNDDIIEYLTGEKPTREMVERFAGKKKLFIVICAEKIKKIPFLQPVPLSFWTSFVKKTYLILLRRCLMEKMLSFLLKHLI